MAERVKFKYHPNIYESNMVETGPEVCQCCGETVDEYYGTMYCIEDIECLCFECIANGKAAEKFDGEFIQDAETDKVDDPEKTEMLFKRTPGYISWQGEDWLACCNDYCAYIGDVGVNQLEEMGIKEQVFEEFDKNGKRDPALKTMVNNGHVSGDLFQCLHCGKYHMGIDLS